MKERKTIATLFKLLKLIKPLSLYMILAVGFGSLGYLSASGIIFIAILGLLKVITINQVIIIIIILAFSRGILRYLEQACNHYVAFKMLAYIRHLIFKKVIELAPTKVENKDKGNFIALITNDVELLEVFFAHTVSPISIAFIVSVTIIVIISQYSITFGLLALVMDIIIGLIIPLTNGKLSFKDGNSYRYSNGELNNEIIDSLYGIKEIKQFQNEDNRINIITKRNKSLSLLNKKLKLFDNIQKRITDMFILLSWIFGLCLAIYSSSFNDSLLCLILMTSSFGPLVALANLSNNLNQVIPSANRVLDLLDEMPIVNEIKEGKRLLDINHIKIDNISFNYLSCNKVINNFNADLKKGNIYGLYGPSGCGKSTILKLLLNFYDLNSGDISYDGISIKEILTKDLYKNIAYITQSEYLFFDSLYNNIDLMEGLDECRIYNGAKRGAIDTFINSLDNKYNSVIGKDGFDLSSGQRQRLSLARAFARDKKVFLLDEPTSNVDSYNEQLILKQIKKYREDAIIVIVSHKKSTLKICDQIINLGENYEFSN